MKEQLLRTCEIIKYDIIYASCELRFLNNNYVIIVLLNGDDIFEDFDLDIDKNTKPELAIQSFENECINRFTCYGEFPQAEVKKESGEEISFY